MFHDKKGPISIVIVSFRFIVRPSLISYDNLDIFFSSKCKFDIIFVDDLLLFTH